MSTYPQNLDALITNVEDREYGKTGEPDKSKPTGAGFHAQLHNHVNEAVMAIEQTLGLEPQGEFADVAARLVAIDAAIAGGDSDLANAVATLTSAINAKQDASTAATDSELATAVETINSALALKQDASSAATDAELLTEKDAREAADASEAKAREVADAAEATARQEADATEKAARESGDSTALAAASTAQATADAALPRSGGTMTGAFTLAGDASTNLQPVTKQQLTAAINALVDGAPEALDTLKEISERLGLDESAEATLVATVATKLAKSANLSDVANAATALANLGGASASGLATEEEARKAADKAERERAEAAEPTPGQKNALAGANGTPGSTNKYLTEQSKGAAGAEGKVLAADDAFNADGTLKSANLASSAISGSPTGGVPAWVKETAYRLNQLVSNEEKTYICLKAHTSGEAFSGAGANWAVLVPTPGISKAEAYALAPEIQVASYFKKAATEISATEFKTAFQEAIEAAEALTGSSAIIQLPRCPAGKSRWEMPGPVKASVNKPLIFVGTGRSGEIKLTVEGKYGECFPVEAKSEAEQSQAEKPWEYWHVYIRSPEGWPTSPNGQNVKGYSPCYSSGFLAPGSSRLYDCQATGFYCHSSLQGFYQQLINCKAFTCFYGPYDAPDPTPQPNIQGSFQQINCEWNVQWARVGCHSGRCLGGSWIEEGGANEQYTVYREAPQGHTGTFTTSPIMGTGAIASQATGLAVVFDESQVSVPSAYYSQPGQFLYDGIPNVKMNSESRVGNVQVLTVGGTGKYKLVIPAQVGPEAGSIANSSFAGATTAEIKATATNAEIQSAINAAIGGGSTCFVSTVESTKKQILIKGKAALMGTTEISVIQLAESTTTIGASHMDPNMGPRVRPVKPQIIEVKNATGGTFKLKITALGETLESEPIAYNATPETFEKALIAMGNVTRWGVVIGNVSSNGKFYCFFNGRLLNETVTIEAVPGGLTGAGAEVKIENGEECKLANRTNDYAFEIGKTNVIFRNVIAELEGGVAGFFRCSLLERLVLEGNAGKIASNSTVQNGEVVIFEFPSIEANKIEYSEIRYRGALFTIRKIAGEVTKGNLLAQKGTGQEAEIFPKSAGEKKGALVNKIPIGYAYAAVPAGKTRCIPIMREMDSNAATSVTLKALCEGEPEAGEALKPSSVTAGKVEKVTEASDLIVGRALAKGSAGTVQMKPMGLT